MKQSKISRIRGELTVNKQLKHVIPARQCVTDGLYAPFKIDRQP
jgi:hypothetical protein